MATKSKAPAARDLSYEMDLIGKSAAQNAGAQAQSQAALYQQMLEQSLGATDAIASRLNNGYTAAGRSALDGAMGQVPELGAIASRLGSLASTAESDVQGTEIERLLQDAALSDLQLGRSLSPEQVRESQQAARAGYAARGMAVGPGSAAAEILNRDLYASGRESDRRTFAGNVNQMVSGNRLNRLGAAGSLLGQDAGVRSNAAQLGMQGAQGYVALDPYMRALGSNLPSSVMGASASMTGNTYGQAMSYGSDLFNTNNNAAWSQYLGNQNQAAALQQARLSAGAASSAGNSALLGSGIAAGGAVLGGVAIAF
jgi:hypothetical protein